MHTTPTPLKKPAPVIVALLMIGGAAIGGFVAAGSALRNYGQYQHMAKGPEQIAVADAFGAEPLPRWVHLNGALELDCTAGGLQQTTNGTVDFTMYLAQDADKRHAFLLQFKGDVDCGTASARPLEGLLVEPSMYWWTKNNMPAPSAPVVELDVGYDPSTRLHDAIWAALVAVMLLACSGVFWSAYVKQRARSERA